MPEFTCRKNTDPESRYVIGKGYVETDVPLIGYWTLSGSVPAGCGHASCGLDWVDYHFVTGADALRFIAKEC